MSEKMNDRIIEDGVLEATKGTINRQQGEDQKAIIGAENSTPKYQFIEKSVIDELEKEEVDRMKKLEEESKTLDNRPLNKQISEQSVSQPVVKIEPQTQKPLVIPRVTITEKNIQRFYDNTYGDQNYVLIIDNRGKILPAAVIALKDANGKVILAQKTNEKGYTQISRKLNNGIYQLAIAAPRNIFPEIVIEVKDRFPSIKISAL